jgi:predicted Zn-dependent protease
MHFLSAFHTRFLRYTRQRCRLAGLLLALFALLFAPCAQAISLIRDAEIEDTLRAYGDPLFRAAGLDPAAVHIFLIDDPSINAYVAGGSNMFIYTGLILKTDRPSMLIGVMAHETGHMAGGHLAQGTEKLENAELGTVLSAVLGIAAAAAGNGDAGMAIMTAGPQVALRNYLHFSRSNESAADQAGLNYLDAVHISASGMLRMLELLRQDENRSFGNPDPYTRTHPLDIDRITHIRAHVMSSPLPEDVVPAGFAMRHARMLAKLNGFMKPPEETLALYPQSDTSIPARYARAIAYYREPDMPKALKEIDSLIHDKPKDPFFHELRGQMLFENGRIPEAVQSYSQAVALLPNSPLILTDYGKVLTATGDKENIEKAQKVLEHASILDNSNPDTWHDLAIAYGKLGNMGMFYLASAEEASLEDKPNDVLNNVALALRNLRSDNVARLRAGDLRLIAEKEKKDMQDSGQTDNMTGGSSGYNASQ